MPHNGNFPAIKPPKTLAIITNRALRQSYVHLTEQSALWNGDVVVCEQADRNCAEELRGEDGSGVICLQSSAGEHVTIGQS